MVDRGSQLWRWTGLAGWWKILNLVRKFLNHSYNQSTTIMCGLYCPHLSNIIFISKEIKDDAEGENAYEEDEDKLQVKKIQPTYLRISTRYDPCMPMMTSKKWDVVALFFKITIVLKISPTLLTQKVPWPSVFLTAKYPLQSALFFFKVGRIPH